MTYHELNAHFKTSDLSPTDFIKWAAGYGVKVHYATISRHQAGTQSITAPWELAYKCFFSSNNGQ